MPDKNKDLVLLKQTDDHNEMLDRLSSVMLLAELEINSTIELLESKFSALEDLRDRLEGLMDLCEDNAIELGTLKQSVDVVISGIDVIKKEFIDAEHLGEEDEGETKKTK